jgi:predicted nucleic acid-binding protein
MSGTKFVIDTNVIIYHLKGNTAVEAVLAESLIYISSLTYSELFSKKLSAGEEEILREYFSFLQIVHTNDFICTLAAEIRKNFKIKLPDAIIAATSFYLDLPLVTFDKDFERIENLKIVKLSL